MQSLVSWTCASLFTVLFSVAAATLQDATGTLSVLCMRYDCAQCAEFTPPRRGLQLRFAGKHLLHCWHEILCLCNPYHCSPVVSCTVGVIPKIRKLHVACSDCLLNYTCWCLLLFCSCQDLAEGPFCSHSIHCLHCVKRTTRRQRADRKTFTGVTAAQQQSSSDRGSVVHVSCSAAAASKVFCGRTVASGCLTSICSNLSAPPPPEPVGNCCPAT